MSLYPLGILLRVRDHWSVTCDTLFPLGTLPLLPVPTPPPPPTPPLLPVQEVRRLNQRMMEVRQSRREEAEQLEATVAELKVKIAALEKNNAQQGDALEQVEAFTWGARGGEGGGGYLVFRFCVY